jgi:trimethylamine--corrinoid protein Co-methyltransferase
MLEPVPVNAETLAIDTIGGGGPGGHFFGTQHTQDRFRNAFYKPHVSDRRKYESWPEAGSPPADQKVEQLVQQYLAAYEEPAMDPSVKAELRAFVDRRIAEGGVATDF